LSSLGLEFKIVLIPWVQQFHSFSSDVDEIIRYKRQLYVAMTRAQDQLYMFGSGNEAVIKIVSKKTLCTDTGRAKC